MANTKITSFRKQLVVGNRAGLDSMIFLYHFADHSKYALLTEIIFDLMENGKLEAITSTITVAEIFVRAEQKGDQIIINEYEKFLQNMPNLEILPVDWTIARLAAKLRAEYPSIRLPDAIQLSAPLIKKYPLFITNDSRLAKAPQIKVLLLDEFT